MREYSVTHHSDPDGPYQLPADIMQPCVFKWDMDEGETIIWEHKSEDKLYAETKSNIKRSRTFTGQFTEVQFSNQNFKAMVFADSFEIDYSYSGDNEQFEFDFSQTSYYAEGIGLHSYVRKLDDDGEAGFTLINILSLEEWEKIKRTE